MRSPAEKIRAAATRELERRKRLRELATRLRSSFADFIRATWHIVDPANPLIDNWHIDAIGEHLQAVGSGQIRRLLINIPPGHAKSIIGAVQFSAWLWAVRPATRIITATHALKLTKRDSIRTGNLVTSSWFRDTFRPDWSMLKTNEDYLSNSASGERYALSVGSGVTGLRGDGHIYDDLLDAQDKHSEPARDAAKDWALSTMSSRFNDLSTGWIVAIGQRLHEEDPYGAMLATGDYVHLCLPSEFEPERRSKTILGWSDPRTEPGELLFPGKFPKEALDNQKRNLGSYDYAGQYQQRPAPAEGGLFKRNWWRYYQREELPSLDFVLISVDATFKAAGDVDYVAIHVWGFAGPRIFLLARRHDRMGFTATKDSIRTLYAEFLPHAVLIEDKANGPAIIEELSREIMGVVAITPEGGKIARAWAASPTVQAGCVYLPNGPDDIDSQEVVEEAAAFPNAAHDDDVDAMTQAINYARKNNDLSVWAKLGGG